MQTFCAQHWSKVEHHVGEPHPVERSSYAMACLGYGEDHPQLLVIGGYSGGYYDGKILNDVWLLDVESGHWRKVSVEVVMGVCVSCHKIYGPPKYLDPPERIMAPPLVQELDPTQNIWTYWTA